MSQLIEGINGKKIGVDDSINVVNTYINTLGSYGWNLQTNTKYNCFLLRIAGRTYWGLRQQWRFSTLS